MAYLGPAGGSSIIEATATGEVEVAEDGGIGAAQERDLAAVVASNKHSNTSVFLFFFYLPVVGVFPNGWTVF